MRPISNVSKHLYDVVLSGLVCTPPTITRRLNWPLAWTTISSRTFLTILTMFCKNFCPRAKLIIQHKTSLVKTLRAHIRRPVCLNIEYVEDKIIDEFESRNLKQFLFLIIHTVLEVTLSDGAATNAM